MKQKTLILSLLLSSMSVGVNAQTNVLFSQGFEDVQNQDRKSVGWYEFINTQNGDERDSLSAEEAHSGAKSCRFYNVAGIDGNSWDRAIKFRNLPIKERTSYRVVYYTKGDNNFIKSDGSMAASNVDAALYCGHDASDTQWAGADQSTGFDGRMSSFNTEGSWKRHAVMGYYVDWNWNETYYLKQVGWKNDKTMPANEFYMSINMYNPGSYYVDDVSVVESTIAGAFFGADAIKIDFGYDNNVKSLASSSTSGKLVINKDCAKVTVNGQQVNILSVECEPDGCLYIFLDESTKALAKTDDVQVSFTNPEDASHAPLLLYTSIMRPRCDVSGDNKAVCNFSGEKAEYDEEVGVDYFSSAYDQPSLVSSDPEDQSFDLPVDIKSFSFTFNNAVNCAKVTAKLSKGSYSEKLDVDPSTGSSKVITARRTSTDALATGVYTLTLSNLLNSKLTNTESATDTSITVAIGSIAVDPGDTVKSVWKENFSELGENVLPADWTVYDGETEVTEYYSDNCPRIMKFKAGGDMDYAFYFRQGRSTGNGYVAYGMKSPALLSLKTGKYELTYNAATWFGNNWYLRCEVVRPDGSVKMSQTVKCTPQLWASQSAINGATKAVVDFELKDGEAGNYVIRWIPCGNENGDRSYNGTMYEVLMSNINLQYRPTTPGLYVKNLFRIALDSAKVALVRSAGARYAGNAYDQLNAIVTKDGSVSFTTPSKAFDAISELNDATAVLNHHKNLIDAYDPLVVVAESIIESYANTKYANDASYIKLADIARTYHGKLLTDDNELKVALDLLNHYTVLCNNMCSSVINDLTARLSKGIKTAVSLGLPESTPSVLAAANAITDDDAVANQLNKDICSQFYHGIVNGSIDFAEKTNPETLETYKDSFDVSCFIKNPNLYTTAVNNSDMSDATCPGWKVTVGNGYAVTWSLGFDDYSVSDVRPAVDAMLSNWCKSFDICQTVDKLPSGIYSLKVGFGERNLDNARLLDNYIYAVTYDNNGAVADSVSLQAPVIGQTYPVDNMVIENIKVGNGKLKIGALAAGDSHVFLNNFSLTLKGKLDTFDYVTSVKGVVDHDGDFVKSIEYFDANGVRTNGHVKGLTIVKSTCQDGTVIIKKKMMK